MDVERLDQQLRLLRIKNLLAIVLGDVTAVARLTCERARLSDAIRLAKRLP
jgi:hypothetical protein